jgi:peptidoglycan/xylan/chitin deacetylase (PgdA/CDA1 family)
LGIFLGVGFVIVALFGILFSLHGGVFRNIQVEAKKSVVKRVAKKSKEGVIGISVVKISVPILMYHYIEYVADPGDKIRISLNVTPYTFENQIKTMKDAGYSFMTASELAQVIDGKAKLPVKPVVLTFDDGYRDFYTDAFPILKKYGVKGTVYVISGFVGRHNYMFPEQVVEVAKSGLVEVGAHTVHHVSLKGVSMKEDLIEIGNSKTDLEKLISMPVVSFAYPNGSFDKQAIEVVKNAGYTSAVSTLMGSEQGSVNKLVQVREGPMSTWVFITLKERVAVKHKLKELAHDIEIIENDTEDNFGRNSTEAK